MKQDETPIFSHLVKVSHISANAVSIHVSANEAERTTLAEGWRISDVRSFEADLQVARWKRDGVKIKGTVVAEIVQECVVSLEPVESRIEEPVEVTFVPEGSRLARIAANDAAEMVLDPEGPDVPDVFSGDSIDIGPVLAEHVALAIDPYPRKPGVEFKERIESTASEDVRPNPFAALKDWKKD